MVNPPIKVMIVEDHGIMVAGLRLLLAEQDNIELVATASNGKEAVTHLNNTAIDIAVVDISMPEMNGEELTKYIRKHHPTIKVLVLSAHKQERYITRMVAAGMHGYILKDNGDAEFVRALNTMMSKGYYYDQEIMHVIIQRQNEEHQTDNLVTSVKLTQRETDVLKLIGKGLQAKEIADALSIAKSTVETHKLNLREKLGLRDVKALTIYAIENGYVE